MKLSILMATMGLLAAGTLSLGTVAADNGVCVDALDSSSLHTTSCTEYGLDPSKTAFCPYTWEGPGAPTEGVFVCGGDPNCNIYYDTFGLGLKGCFNGGVFQTLGNEIWSVGSTVDNLVP